MKPETFLISFPKCGRTWLRLMVGRAIANHFGLLSHSDILSAILNLTTLADLHPDIPKIKIKHDDKPQWKRPDRIISSKNMYKNTNVILLVREPKDTIVSNYFQKKKRRKVYERNLSDYIREKIGSLESLLTFYNIWAENQHIPQKFLLVRYEDMQANPGREMRRFLSFIELNAITNEEIDEAVEFASFDNMRRMEEKGNFSSILKPVDPSDPESYKTRKGKVAGFTEYLTSEDIEYINYRMKEVLSPASKDLYRYQI